MTATTRNTSPITRLPDGRYRLKMRLPGGGWHNRIYPTEYLATKAYLEILEAGRPAAAAPASAQPFGVFLVEEWFPAYRARGSSRRSRWIWITNHILPRLGDIPLRDLTTLRLQAFVGELERTRVKKRNGEPTNRTLAPTTIANIFAIVSMALDAAVAAGKIPSNPATGVVLPQVRRRVVHYWTPEQLARFLDHAEAEARRAARGGRKKVGSHSIWVVLAHTGLRINEALALTWDDIDVARKTITVSRTHTRDESGRRVVGDPKTDTSARTITIGPTVIAALRAQQDAQAFRRKRAEAAGVAWDPTGWVFDREFPRAEPGKPRVPDGRPTSQITLNVAFAKLVATCPPDDEGRPLPPLTPHGLRHTHAANLLRRGYSLKLVQERLGHADFATTANLYAHIADDINAQAAVDVEELVEAYRAKQLSHTSYAPQGL